MSNKIKQEFFRKGTRFVHRFGPETQDPFASREFDPHFPIEPTQQRSRPLSIQKEGEYRYFEPQSPIVKPGNRVASTNGPSPDRSDPVAQTIPSNTIKRKSPP